jgi:hypothetical protein
MSIFFAGNMVTQRHGIFNPPFAPTYVYPIVTLVIGGGGGGSNNYTYSGGNGGYVVPTIITATTGNTYSFNAGAGGLTNQVDGSNNVIGYAQDGYASTIQIGATTLVTAAGGTANNTYQGSIYCGGYGAGNINPPTYNGDPNESSQFLNGGDGATSSITGALTYYAGGGAGCDAPTGKRGSNGRGIIGQGGQGGYRGVVGNGTTGAVILRLLKAYYTGKIKGNPIVTFNGSYVILTYNNSGSYIA